MAKKEVNLIEFEWRGPFTLNQIKEWVKKDSDDNERPFDKNGLYQIYGTHPIFGKSSLLYIGKTTNSFQSRFGQHASWLKWEYDDPEIYLGTLRDQNISEEEQSKLIGIAEELLIHYTCPPYNSQNIVDAASVPKLDSEYLVINHGKISTLLPCISTLNYNSDYYEF